jgi:hypothetical protein
MSPSLTHVYQVRLCRDKRGFDLISDALPPVPLSFGTEAFAI